MFLNNFFFIFDVCMFTSPATQSNTQRASSASAVHRKLFAEKSFPVFGVKTIQWIKICQIELNSRKFCNLLEFASRHEKPNYINRPTAAWRRQRCTGDVGISYRLHGADENAEMMGDRKNYVNMHTGAKLYQRKTRTHKYLREKRIIC